MTDVFYMPNFVEVILPIAVERFFSYRINAQEANVLTPGMRVAVNFGKSKIYTAIVYRLHQEEISSYEVKDIEFIIDDFPIVTPTQLKFWSWIGSYYMCSVGQVMKAALPKSLLLESETIILLNEDAAVDPATLSDDAFLVLEALENVKSLKIQDIIAILDRKTVLPLIKKLIDNGLIILQEEVYNTYKPKTDKYIRLNDAYAGDDALRLLLDELSRAHKQREVVMTLFMLRSGGGVEVSSKDLMNRAQVSRTVIKQLIDKEILLEEEKVIDRVLENRATGTALFELNEVQKKAFVEIKDSFATNKVTLLHGVTSSGKTEIYVRLIKEQLEAGKQALYLLPEIALTTQLIARLRNFFKHQVLVYHSNYNLNERLEVWNHVLLANEPYVIIGARSAMWLPFQDLGLIIIDEEHETSFKQQDPAPRYHARDASIFLANMVEAHILLGSATPSLETFYNVKTNKYTLVSLLKRYGNRPMPAISLIDLKDKKHRKKMSGHFSDTLITAMQETFNKGEQVILFQNRRGFAPIMECDTCGYAPQCPNCDVSLTYHQFKKQLRCHYCGHHTYIPQECGACSSTALDTKGFGTEQIEQEFLQLFPDKKVSRMDLDTTRGRDSYEKIIKQVDNGTVDCLVGTQMLTKGLDFRNVSLVGVLQADTMLNFPDFRSHERCFQLLTQVAGRAGRTHSQGTVLIQSFNPLHKILQQVCNYDFTDMADSQLLQRYEFNYPPYKRLIKLTFKHREYNRALESANWFVNALNQLEKGAEILGPEFPVIARVRNLYNIHIIVKIDKSKKPNDVKSFIKKVYRSFESVPNFRSVRCNIDVDPY